MPSLVLAAHLAGDSGRSESQPAGAGPYKVDEGQGPPEGGLGPGSISYAARQETL